MSSTVEDTQPVVRELIGNGNNATGSYPSCLWEDISGNTIANNSLEGTFSLIVEALHDNNNSTGRPGLDCRGLEDRSLDPGWV
uniref:Uncharacterized protein n=1 Tax=Timema genevievae TaxID=629358 RepID=A0A7R9K144_TIMGE|nr:unnamed protein product [Timema genevievae]